MKNLTGALVFSSLLSLAVGCHKNTGESPDAATPTGTVQKELQTGREDASSAPAPTAAASTGDSGTSTSASSYDASASDRLALESCVDGWLKSQNLDRYGSKEGTMYAGGTPLFDERTGETTDRMEFVLKQHPAAKKACVTQDAGK